MSAMTERTCGACSLCCKLPYVPELRKPIDTWCKHAAPGCGGCLIYPKRPRSCRDYICGWLSSEPGVGDEWFPAQCHMMLTPRRIGMRVTVDPDSPDAWLREPYYKQIRQWAQQKPVEIRIGWRWLWLNPDLPESEMPKIQKWLEGGRA